ncbi:MAG: DUF2905 domain-containing protein [Candidatus Omnitrophota bacterium]
MTVGKALILLGVILVVLGLMASLGNKISWLGRLPGDIYIRRKDFKFYFPITTSVLLSALLTIALFFLRKR